MFGHHFPPNKIVRDKIGEVYSVICGVFMILSFLALISIFVNDIIALMGIVNHHSYYHWLNISTIAGTLFGLLSLVFDFLESRHSTIVFLY